MDSDLSQMNSVSASRRSTKWNVCGSNLSKISGSTAVCYRHIDSDKYKMLTISHERDETLHILHHAYSDISTSDTKLYKAHCVKPWVNNLCSVTNMFSDLTLYLARVYLIELKLVPLSLHVGIQLHCVLMAT